MQPQLQVLPPLTSLPQALHHYDITPSRRHHHCHLLALLGWFQPLWAPASWRGRGAQMPGSSEGGALGGGPAPAPPRQWRRG